METETNGMANAINLPAFNHCNHDMAAVAFTRVGL